MATRAEEKRISKEWGSLLPRSEQALVKMIAARHMVDIGVIWMAYYAGATSRERIDALDIFRIAKPGILASTIGSKNGKN